MTVTCPSCGSINTEGTGACASCGAAIMAPAPGGPAPETPSSQGAWSQPAAGQPQLQGLWPRQTQGQAQSSQRGEWQNPPRNPEVKPADVIPQMTVPPVRSEQPPGARPQAPAQGIPPGNQPVRGGAPGGQPAQAPKAPAGPQPQVGAPVQRPVPRETPHQGMQRQPGPSPSAPPVVHPPDAQASPAPQAAVDQRPPTPQPPEPRAEGSRVLPQEPETTVTTRTEAEETGNGRAVTETPVQEQHETFTDAPVSPDGSQWGYGVPQPYGAAFASPWYSPYPMQGFPSPFPGFFGWPFPTPYMPPPCMAMAYQMGFPYQNPQYPYGAMPGPHGAPAARRKRMRPLYIVLIILGVLIVVGGGVAAAILLSGSSNASFNLGDGSVVGSNIEFHNMILKQQGDTLTLSGTYDNTGTYKGEVVVTVQAAGQGGQEQLLSFTVSVVSGSGKTFRQQKSAGSVKLSGATLSSIVATGSTQDNTGTNTFPFGTESSPGSSSTPSSSSSTEFPSSIPESSTPFDTVP